MNNKTTFRPLTGKQTETIIRIGLVNIMQGQIRRVVLNSMCVKSLIERGIISTQGQMINEMVFFTPHGRHVYAAIKDSPEFADYVEGFARKAMGITGERPDERI